MLALVHFHSIYVVSKLIISLSHHVAWRLSSQALLLLFASRWRPSCCGRATKHIIIFRPSARVLTFSQRLIVAPNHCQIPLSHCPPRSRAPEGADSHFNKPSEDIWSIFRVHAIIVYACMPRGPLPLHLSGRLAGLCRVTCTCKAHPLPLQFGTSSPYIPILVPILTYPRPGTASARCKQTESEAPAQRHRVRRAGARVGGFLQTYNIHDTPPIPIHRSPLFI